jgi:hypothetical protein
MKKLKLITIALLIFILQGCCLSYQPKLVDKIVQPFSKEIKTFYAIHNRYPDDKELDMVLAKIHWKKITVSNDYDCNGNKCHISTLFADKKSVDLSIKYNNTFCNYYFKNKKIEKQCYKEPCFSFRQ